MELRKWRNRNVPAEIGDDFLNRLFSVPGISVSALSYGGIDFDVEEWEGATPGSSESSKEHVAYHLRQALEDISWVHAQLEPDGALRFSINKESEPWDKPVARTDTAELRAWRQEVVERLEKFAESLNLEPQAIESLEEDILGGAASVLTWRERTPHNRRDDPIFFYEPSPSALEEAGHLLRELEAIHGTRLYYIYLDSIRNRGFPNDSNQRKWFGTGIAMKAIGRRDERLQEHIEGTAVPKWFRLMDGPYYACVFNPYSRSLTKLKSLVLVAHQPSKTWRFMHLHDLKDKGLRVLVDRRIDGVCFEGGKEDAERWFKREYSLQRALVSRNCADGLAPEELIEFLVSNINLPEDSVRQEMEMSLADCFQL